MPITSPSPSSSPTSGVTRRQGKASGRRGRMAGAAPGAAPVGTPISAGAAARLRYRFDNALARGPGVVIAYLAVLSVLVVLAAAVIAVVGQMSFGGGLDDSFVEEAWQALLRTVDAGTFVGDTAWPTRLLGLAVTLIGIFLAGSLIGLIANAVDQKVENLRRGTSPVVESGHTLVLGWSAQVPRIVAELVAANESEKHASVVVLADADKTVMEDALRAHVPDTRTTRVVCRSGNPAAPADLQRASVETARSVVVVRGADGDAGVVKAVLAVRTTDPDFARAHVVAEVAETDHAATLRAVSGGRVLTVSSDDVVAEVTAQACLQSGLTAVFTDLLDFEGDEIYFVAVPELDGCTYGEALLAFETSSLIGCLVDGVVALNPPTATVLAAGDELILVAADDAAVTCTGVQQVAVPVGAPGAPEVAAPVRIAIVGWSTFGAKVVGELDEFLAPGSTLTVVVDADLVDVAATASVAPVNATLEVRRGTGGPDDVLGLLEPAAPDQVIVLGYRDALGVDDADARTLLTLLTLRQQWPDTGPGRVRVVAELGDQRNLVLAEAVGVDDLIVSDALTSLLMAQLSERAELLAVFDELFDVDGAVVEVRPAGWYVPPAPMAFAAVVAAGAAQGVSAFGYRIGATGAVVVNPPKGATVDLGPDDQVIVVGARVGR